MKPLSAQPLFGLLGLLGLLPGGDPAASHKSRGDGSGSAGHDRLGLSADGWELFIRRVSYLF